MMSMDSYRGGNGSVITATTTNNAKTSTGWYEQQCHQQQQHQVTMSSNQLDTSSTTTTDMQLLEEARKMCMQDIDVACKKLGISPDPYSWSMGEVFSWLRWLQTSNNLLPIHLDYFQLDGEHLCRLSEHDFRQRCPTPEVGEFIYGRLDLWKLGFSYLNQTPTTDTYDYGGRQAAAAATATQYDNSYGNSCPITTTTTATSNMGSYAADAGYGSIPRPNQLSYHQHQHHHHQQQQPHVHQSQHQHYGSPSAAFSPSSNAGSNYSSCMSPVPSPAGSISSSVSSSSSSSCYGTSPSHFGGAGHMTPHSFASTATSLGGQSPPNTTATSTTNSLGHMFNVNSHTSDYGSDGILSDDDDIEDDKWMVRAMLAQQQQPPAQYPVVGNNVQQQQQPQQHPGLSMYAGSGYSPSHVSYHHHHHHQHAMSPPTGSSYARPVANMATTAAAGQVMSSSAVSSTTPAAATTTTTIMPTTLVKPMIKTGSGSSIHLWQFLKELLQSPQTYSGFIRWLDREKGVFKIEDSVRVAKLWGGRKNRPAMNYDKLSRSIRQYYKKGIMKKTERSQRLVYQFCAPYAL